MDGDITVRIVTSVEAIDRDDWDRVAAGAGRHPDGRPADPFLAWDFFQALEASGSIGGRTGWHPHYLAIDGADGRLIALAPCFLKSHSRGEYVFDHAWADAWTRAGGRYYPKLQLSVPFTPVTGPRLLVDADAPDRAGLASALVAAMEETTRRAGLATAHATFLDADDRATFEAAGWAMREDRQFHFPNRGYRDYDDFLATLLGRKRKQLARERRDAAAGLEIVSLTGGDVRSADWDAFFAFYMDTGSRKWGTPYLNRAFFARIGETMADRVLLVLARDAGRPIAGALNFIGTDALYGRWWGAIEERPFLHFELCYHRAVDWAIAHGLARVEAGAQGDHKLARGYLPVATHSAHHLAHPGFRAAVDDFLAHERAALAEADADLLAASPYADRAALTASGGA